MRARIRSRGAQATNKDPIQAILSSGVSGIYLKPWEASSQYQDAAGTIPAAAGSGVWAAKNFGSGSALALATSTSTRPTLTNDNGTLCWAFDGIDDALKLDVSSVGGTWNCFIVASTDSVSGNATILQFGNGGTQYTTGARRSSLTAIAAQYSDVSVTSALAASVFSAGERLLMHSMFNGTSAVISCPQKLTSGSGSALTGVARTGAASAYIGRNSAAASGWWRGKVYAVVYLACDLTGQQSDDIINFLAAKTGVLL